MSLVTPKSNDAASAAAPKADEAFTPFSHDLLLSPSLRRVYAATPSDTVIFQTGNLPKGHSVVVIRGEQELAHLGSDNFYPFCLPQPSHEADALFKLSLVVTDETGKRDFRPICKRSYTEIIQILKDRRFSSSPPEEEIGTFVATPVIYIFKGSEDVKLPGKTVNFGEWLTARNTGQLSPTYRDKFEGACCAGTAHKKEGRWEPDPSFNARQWIDNLTSQLASRILKSIKNAPSCEHKTKAQTMPGVFLLDPANTKSSAPSHQEKQRSGHASPKEDEGCHSHATPEEGEEKVLDNQAAAQPAPSPCLSSLDYRSLESLKTRVCVFTTQDLPEGGTVMVIQNGIRSVQLASKEFFISDSVGPDSTIDIWQVAPRYHKNRPVGWRQTQKERYGEKSIIDFLATQAKRPRDRAVVGTLLAVPVIDIRHDSLKGIAASTRTFNLYDWLCQREKGKLPQAQENTFEGRQLSTVCSYRDSQRGRWEGGEKPSADVFLDDLTQRCIKGIQLNDKRAVGGLDDFFE